MKRYQIIPVVLSFVFANAVNAADTKLAGREIPLIRADSTDIEVEAFYKALDGKIEVWFAHYFQTSDKKFYKEYDQEYKKATREAEQMGKEGAANADKLAKIVEGHGIALSLMPKVHEQCAFADARELSKQDGEFKIDVAMTDKEPKRALRILQSNRLAITYVPLVAGEDYCDLYRKVGHSDACPAVQQMLDLVSLIQRNIRNFTRQHADVFNRLAALEDRTVINQMQYSEFLLACREFFSAQAQICLGIEEIGKNIPGEALKLVEQEMSISGIECAKAKVHFSCKVNKKEKEFEKPRNEWPADVISQQLGIKVTVKED